MKKSFTILPMAAYIIFISFYNISCKKVSESLKPKEELVIGKWAINRVQLRIYYNGTFTRDSIIPLVKQDNYVTFGSAGGSFAYRFNTPIPENGTYQWMGSDSLLLSTSKGNYSWKKLTLTDVLFTVMNNTTDPALPGATIEVYQTFVR